jgi:hypothetical protein
MGIIRSVVKFTIIAALARGIVGKIQKMAAKEGEKAAPTPPISDEGMRNTLLRVRRAQDEMRAALASFEEELKGCEEKLGMQKHVEEKPAGLYGSPAVRTLGPNTYANAEHLLKAVNAPNGASIESVRRGSEGEIVNPNMGIYQFPNLPLTDEYFVTCRTGPGTFTLYTITVKGIMDHV